jgi:hypothetical protein
MSKKHFPGVYEILLKKKGIQAPVHLGISYTAFTEKGSVLTYRDKKYLIIDRSGLHPTGVIVVKEI